MSNPETARSLQFRLAVVANELRQVHADLLALPADVDAEAIPVIRRAIADAKYSVSVGFYALGCLHNSMQR